ncbi:hypothetical protein [Polymorphospora sp. NPDC050346]|uniref:hypothetical protein n=1 Tax=Polymorphospora sp. NPDC050346 TaxID=3155780 RepID=UPI0034030554
MPENGHPEPADPTNTGRWVEYHGSDRAWHGHALQITHRAHTRAGIRYMLANHAGEPVLSGVRPGSVSPIRTTPTPVWAEEIKAITDHATATGINPTLIERHLTTIRRQLDRYRYVAAQRHLTNMAAAIHLITEQERQDRLAELDQAHGPDPASQHRHLSTHNRRLLADLLTNPYVFPEDRPDPHATIDPTHYSATETRRLNTP